MIKRRRVPCNISSDTRCLAANTQDNTTHSTDVNVMMARYNSTGAFQNSWSCTKDYSKDQTTPIAGDFSNVPELRTVLETRNRLQSQFDALSEKQKTSLKSLDNLISLAGSPDPESALSSVGVYSSVKLRELYAEAVRLKEETQPSDPAVTGA